MNGNGIILELILIGPIAPFMLFVLVVVIAVLYCKITKNRKREDGIPRDNSFDQTFNSLGEYNFDYNEKFRAHHTPYFVEDEYVSIISSTITSVPMGSLIEDSNEIMSRSHGTARVVLGPPQFISNRSEMAPLAEMEVDEVR